MGEKRMLDEKKVFAAIDNSESAVDAVIAVFKEVLPEWDDIENVEGYLKSNKKTSLEIGNRLMGNFRAGGLPWMQYGFSSLDTEHLRDWEIELPNIIMKKKALKLALTEDEAVAFGDNQIRTKPIKAECLACGTGFDLNPKPYPSAQRPWSEEKCKQEHVAHPALFVDCPKCNRRYFKIEDGIWFSDRSLLIKD